MEKGPERRNNNALVRPSIFPFFCCTPSVFCGMGQAGSKHPITDSTQKDKMPFFSPNGRSIHFVRQRSGQRMLLECLRWDNIGRTDRPPVCLGVRKKLFLSVLVIKKRGSQYFVGRRSNGVFALPWCAAPEHLLCVFFLFVGVASVPQAWIASPQPFLFVVTKPH